MSRTLKLLALALVGSCLGCAGHFRYVEDTAPSDVQLVYRYTAPAAASAIALNAAKVRWYWRLPLYAGVWVECRYGTMCHRPESVGLNLAMGWWLGEAYYFIRRRGIR